MCGIAGIVTVEMLAGLRCVGQAMEERLRHRGPDDQGWLTYCRGGLRRGQDSPDDGPIEVMLLHRRLSILDLSPAGRQPMSSPDERYHIVFNGEIYNYLELRRELAAAGYTFRTGTDTEVLLSAFAHWGEKSFERLVGMFAFAILDTQTRNLWLVRDFFAIKPLFYWHTKDRFAFASEIKSLLEFPCVSRQVNPEVLYGYLRFGKMDQTPETFFSEIQRVPAGSFIRICLDGPIEARTQQYWRLDPSQRAELSFEEAARQLREMFLDSVRLHMRSDVPVGTALSGGVDSSAIVMAVREVCGRDIDFHTFSFVARGSPFDEERWVDIVTKAAATRSHKVHITGDELVAHLDHLIATQDEPVTNTSMYAQYRVFRLAQEIGAKVLLDGQGADELFAGYRWYLPARVLSLLQERKGREAIAFVRHALRLPETNLLSMLSPVVAPLVPRWLDTKMRGILGRAGTWPGWLHQSWFDACGLDTSRLAPRGPRNGLRAALVQSIEQGTLPALLRYEDRNSMAFSIESRVPFLTPQIAQFAVSLPVDYLIGPDGTSKYVFRAAMRGIVPDAILDRRDKIGFHTPELDWLRAVRPWVEGVLRSETARAIPVLNHGALWKQWHDMVAGERAFSWEVWRCLNLIRWSETLKIRY